MSFRYKAVASFDNFRPNTANLLIAYPMSMSIFVPVDPLSVDLFASVLRHPFAVNISITKFPDIANFGIPSPNATNFDPSYEGSINFMYGTWNPFSIDFHHFEPPGTIFLVSHPATSIVVPSDVFSTNESGADSCVTVETA